MRIKIHKMETWERCVVGTADSISPFPVCGDHIWTLGSKTWKRVSCEKCLKKKPKQNKKQWRLFLWV